MGTAETMADHGSWWLGMCLTAAYKHGWASSGIRFQLLASAWNYMPEGIQTETLA